MNKLVIVTLFPRTSPVLNPSREDLAILGYFLNDALVSGFANSDRYFEFVSEIERKVMEIL